MKSLGQQLGYWFGDESGGSLVEYIMLASLIAVVSVSAVTLLGKSVQGKLEAPSAALAR